MKLWAKGREVEVEAVTLKVEQLVVLKESHFVDGAEVFHEIELLVVGHDVRCFGPEQEEVSTK